MVKLMNCPKCGDIKAYTSAIRVECNTPECENYKDIEGEEPYFTKTITINFEGVSLVPETSEEFDNFQINNGQKTQRKIETCAICDESCDFLRETKFCSKHLAEFSKIKTFLKPEEFIKCKLGPEWVKKADIKHLDEKLFTCCTQSFGYVHIPKGLLVGPSEMFEEQIELMREARRRSSRGEL